MTARHATSRRTFLHRLLGTSAGLLVLACQSTPPSPTSPAKPTEAKPAPAGAPGSQPEPTRPDAPAGQAAPVAKTALAPMKIGLQANVLAVPSKVAVDIGAFDKYSLKVEPIKFEAAGNIVRDAILGDQVQAGTFFVATFIVGAATGRVAAFIASHSLARGTGIIARPDIKTVADLRGKRIGGARGTSGSQIFENKIVPANGLSKEDYTWVPLAGGGADSLGAFLAGTIDAYPSAEPYLSLGIKKGGGVLVTDYSPYDPMHLFVAGPTGFAEQNPESVIALMRGWLDMARFWKENPGKVMDIARAFLSGGDEQLEDDILKTSIERLDLKPDLSPALLDPYFKETADLLLQVGNIKQIPDWSKTVRYDLWEKATKA